MAEKTTAIQFPEPLAFFFDSDYCRYRIAYGGRSSGKSWTAAQALIVRALQKKIRILCCREIQNSIKDSVKKTLENSIERMGLSSFFTSTKDGITAYNGSEFIFKGLYAHPEQIKSLENISIAYVEEAESVSKESWDVLIPTIRAENSEIWICFNPRDKEDETFQRFVVSPPKNSVSAWVNYTDNPFCPQVMIDEAEALREKNLDEYNHIWLGFCRVANQNALWKSKLIDSLRVPSVNPDELDRIVIAIDPAATSKASSDETGIVAAGVKYGRNGADDQFYVLEDASLRGTPVQWARTALELYYFYSADRIIAEVNNGGDMVESVIRNADDNVSYSAVRATRGKILRAEPVAALYEQRRVHHAGYFAILESQMCNFTGSDGEKSPDRLDALVWAITELADGGSGEASDGGAAAFTY